MLPNTPTMIEFGYPGFIAANWWGMAAPAGTSDDIIQKLNRALIIALQQPDVVSRFKEMGLVQAVGSPKEFASSLKPQAGLWRETIERGHIKAE